MIKENIYSWYRNMLKSSQWRQLSRIYRNDTDAKCWICESKENLNLHHLRYLKKLFFDSTNLVLLCQKCHKELHYPNGHKAIHRNLKYIKNFRDKVGEYAFNDPQP